MKINLKKIREDKNISQKALSSISGVSQNYISEIEARKKVPSLEVLEKIANALEICIALLIIDEKSNCHRCERHKCAEGVKNEIKK